MPLPVVAALFVVFTLVGAAVDGLIGAVAGAGLAFGVWAKHGEFMESLKAAQEPRKREPFRLLPNDLITMIPLAVLFLYVFVTAFKGSAGGP